jgi:hypothetical protein
MSFSYNNRELAKLAIVEAQDYDRLLLQHDGRVAGLKRAITAWGKSRKLWQDCFWATWDHVMGNQRPSAYTALLCVNASFVEDMYDHHDEWWSMLQAHGFWYEQENSWALIFYPKDHAETEAVERRAMLRWLGGLVTPDVATVYGEVYSWFAKHPDMIQRLPWRAFEELVASAFAGQGITTQLGTGRADQGIDLRLLDHPVLGDVLTVVQMKSGRTPVRLHYVQALAAASVVDGSDRAILVSGSRFLPGAVSWAKSWERTAKRSLELATARDVAKWCGLSWERSWLPGETIRDDRPLGTGPLIGKVMVAFTGYSNVFGQVVRQTPGAILMKRLRERVVPVAATANWGEVPDLESGPYKKSVSDSGFVVAIRGASDDDAWAGVDGEYYRPWDGEPERYIGDLS